jgi:hypothetical protein
VGPPAHLRRSEPGGLGSVHDLFRAPTSHRLFIEEIRNIVRMSPLFQPSPSLSLAHRSNRLASHTKIKPWRARLPRLSAPFANRPPFWTTHPTHQIRVSNIILHVELVPLIQMPTMATRYWELGGSPRARADIGTRRAGMRWEAPPDHPPF